MLSKETENILFEQLELLAKENKDLVSTEIVGKKCEPELISKNVLAMVEIAKLLNH